MDELFGHTTGMSLSVSHRELITPALWTSLCGLAPPRRHSAQAVLLRQGDQGTHALALADGQAMSTFTDSNGHRTILGLRGPGELVGELSVLDGLPRSAACVAVQDCTVHAIPADTFLRFLRDNDLLETLLRHSVGRLREAEALRHELATQRVADRLLHSLERLLQRTGGDKRIHLTQSELAELVGASRNAVVAALRPWIANGWVAPHPIRGLIVKDLPAARRHERRAGIDL